jgi:hypothetical protein
MDIEHPQKIEEPPQKIEVPANKIDEDGYSRQLAVYGH